MPFGLYIFLIVFNVVLTILICPRYFQRLKQLRNTMLFYRLVASGIAVVWFWIVIIYQTVVYIS